MSHETGEDQRALFRILDLLRVSGILILLLHFYFLSYPDGQPANPILDRLLTVIIDTGGFNTMTKPKLIALGLLAISLLGARGKKMPEYTLGTGLAWLFSGLFLYFASAFLIGAIWLYMIGCASGFLLTLHGGIYLSRIVWRRSEPDLFNRLHESFPQEERRLTNAWSINLPARYCYKKEERDSWVNIIDPFRGTLILGSPGSGKTWYLVEPMIRQFIERKFSILVYDFKYDDLSRIVYNHFEKNRSAYPATTAYYNLHFGDLNRSHRCNPLHPATLDDLQDAGEAARTVLLGMQTQGGERQSEFFLESAINFVQALIWFLRLYKQGVYCSWPHVIELAQTSYNELFPVLSAEPQLRALVKPFIDAYHDAPEQLSGQIASATISLARLSSPQVYYIMSGNDFTLDLNNPAAPKLLTIGSNPQKTDTYGPMISAYINTINRLANRKAMYPLAEIFDEFSTVKVHTIIKTIATGRSNKMAVTLCTQDASQLRLAYGKEFTDVILNSCGNILSGQTGGDTAKLLSDRFGKTMQDRESLTTNTADLQITQSSQLEYVLPVSRIASLSAGEFVGMVADTPTQPIAQKTFCCRLTNDPAALTRETAAYHDLP
ncbi:MAG TPA: YWFCY domain-containing protein, partial [Puia sp.]|nr:YWFCY domain-containing protein [Puia sp.]